MTENGLQVSIADLIEEYGVEAVLSEARIVAERVTPASVCTIIVNGGLHRFPDHLVIGERYTFYEGSLDLSSEAALNAFVVDRLILLSKFLRSKKWKSIYLLISGHAAVCVQVKLAIYRITHIESTDWVFDGAGNYLKLSIPLRRIISSSQT